MPLETKDTIGNKLIYVSREVIKLSQDNLSYISELKDIMDSENKIALAACQIGKDIRVVTFIYKDKKVVLINPEITNKKDSWNSMEGCVSIPAYYYSITRPKSCSIIGYDEDMNIVKYDSHYPTEAAMFCHLVDHLDGICIDDTGKIEDRKEDMVGISRVVEGEEYPLFGEYKRM